MCVCMNLVLAITQCYYAYICTCVYVYYHRNSYGQTARDMGHFHWLDQMFSEAPERPLATPTFRTMHVSLINDIIMIS